MIRKAKQVIVVEGKHDIDLLSSFLDADFIKDGDIISKRDTKYA